MFDVYRSLRMVRSRMVGYCSRIEKSEARTHGIVRSVFSAIINKQPIGCNAQLAEQLYKQDDL